MIWIWESEFICSFLRLEQSQIRATLNLKHFEMKFDGNQLQNVLKNVLRMEFWKEGKVLWIYIFMPLAYYTKCYSKRKNKLKLELSNIYNKKTVDVWKLYYGCWISPWNGESRKKKLEYYLIAGQTQ